jgi:hypothetical protein
MSKQSDPIIKNQIEVGYNELSDNNKSIYIQLTKYILKKHGDKIFSMFKFATDEMENTLSLCIFAVSNNKSYNKQLEFYIQASLNEKLSVGK